MTDLNGMRVYETLPAHSVDLAEAVVVTLASIIQDNKDYGIGLAEIDNIQIANTTEDNVSWALSVMPNSPPVIIVDVAHINDSVLLSLQSAGVISR